MTLESIHHNKHSHLLFTQNTTWDKIQHISPHIFALMEYSNHLEHINIFGLSRDWIVLESKS